MKYIDRNCRKLRNDQSKIETNIKNKINHHSSVKYIAKLILENLDKKNEKKQIIRMIEIAFKEKYERTKCILDFRRAHRSNDSLLKCF